jgi:hypothetical protein
VNSPPPFIRCGGLKRHRLIADVTNWGIRHRNSSFYLYSAVSVTGCLDIFHSVLQHGIEELELCLLCTRNNKGEYFDLYH